VSPFSALSAGFSGLFAAGHVSGAFAHPAAGFVSLAAGHVSGAFAHLAAGFVSLAAGHVSGAFAHPAAAFFAGGLVAGAFAHLAAGTFTGARGRIGFGLADRIGSRAGRAGGSLVGFDGGRNFFLNGSGGGHSLSLCIIFLLESFELGAVFGRGHRLGHEGPDLSAERAHFFHASGQIIGSHGGNGQAENHHGQHGQRQKLFHTTS